MKIIYDSTNIDRELLKKEGKDSQIKLEYYKIINEDEFIDNKNKKYGIEIRKIEYIDGTENIEIETIRYISNIEEDIIKLLKLLKDNLVTPITVKDIVEDLSKKVILCK